MVSDYEVFDAVRRGYKSLENYSNEDIIEYFQSIDTESISHHINHIKGILFEQEYLDKLEAEGITAKLFEFTNHPLTDIAIIENGDIVNELQLKATESVSYINATLEENPDILVVATSEVANSISNDMVIDSGISETILEEAISESLFPIPISPIGIGIGLLTGLFFG